MHKLKQATQKLGAFMLALLMFLAIVPITQIHADTKPPISVLIDGQPVKFTGQPPQIINGQTLVPVRGVFEALGFEVSWNQGLKQATLTRANDTIVITTDSATFTTNGAKNTLDVPAQIIGGSIMLPLRAVLDSVGYSLVWDEQAQTVLISSPGTEPTTTVAVNSSDDVIWLDSSNSVSRSQIVNRLSQHLVEHSTHTVYISKH